MHMLAPRHILLLASLSLAACSSGAGTETETASTTVADTTSGTTTDPGTDTTETPTDTGLETTEQPTTEPPPTSSTTADDTTSGTTTSDDTTSGTTTGGDELELSNVALPCNVEDFTYPLLPDEAGQRAASSLKPPSYPFEVTRVRYELGGAAINAQCANTMAHLVEVHVSDAAKPDASPSVNAASWVSISVPDEADAADLRAVELTLDPPLTLSDGQHLVVSVELVASMDLMSSLCLRSCADAKPVVGVDWWSGAAAEPYMWADMIADFGFTTNFLISAYGTAG